MKISVIPKRNRKGVEYWRLKVGSKYTNHQFDTQKEAIKEAEEWGYDVYVYNKEGKLRAAYRVVVVTSTYRFPIRSAFSSKTKK